jgi:hypothetical protein
MLPDVPAVRPDAAPDETPLLLPLKRCQPPELDVDPAVDPGVDPAVDPPDAPRLTLAAPPLVLLVDPPVGPAAFRAAELAAIPCAPAPPPPPAELAERAIACLC